MKHIRSLTLVLVMALVAGGLSGCIVTPGYYAAPAPVYVAPAPVYVAPGPVYYGYGWGGWRGRHWR